MYFDELGVFDFFFTTLSSVSSSQLLSGMSVNMKIIMIFANSCILHVDNSMQLDDINFMYFDDLLDSVDFL